MCKYSNLNNFSFVLFLVLIVAAYIVLLAPNLLIVGTRRVSLSFFLSGNFHLINL